MQQRIHFKTRHCQHRSGRRVVSYSAPCSYCGSLDIFVFRLVLFYRVVEQNSNAQTDSI